MRLTLALMQKGASHNLVYIRMALLKLTLRWQLCLAMMVQSRLSASWLKCTYRLWPKKTFTLYMMHNDQQMRGPANKAASYLK